MRRSRGGDFPILETMVARCGDVATVPCARGRPACGANGVLGLVRTDYGDHRSAMDRLERSGGRHACSSGDPRLEPLPAGGAACPARGGSGHCPVLVPGFRRMGQFTRLQNLAIHALAQDRDGCFLIGAAVVDAGLPLAPGILQIVLPGGWTGLHSSLPEVSMSARMSFIRGLPISWPIRNLRHRSADADHATAQGSRGRAPCPAGHRAESAMPGRGALAARRFRRDVNLVHGGAPPTARLLARALRRPRTFVSTALGG